MSDLHRALSAAVRQSMGAGPTAANATSDVQDILERMAHAYRAPMLAKIKRIKAQTR